MSSEGFHSISKDDFKFMENLKMKMQNFSLLLDNNQVNHRDLKGLEKVLEEKFY